MIKRIYTGVVAGAIALSMLAGPLAQPAAASTGSTYTLIESGLALIGGIILYNNYEHKRQAATTIVGYTRNGGTVYGDGRIVMPNGETIYPGRNGQYPWGQYAYYQPNAGGYTYDYQRTGQYDRTHRHARYRARYDNDDYRDRDDAVRRYHAAAPRYRSAAPPHGRAYGHEKRKSDKDKDDHGGGGGRHHRG